MDMVKQAPVGAHYGLRDWLLQRITAVIMVIFTISAIGLLVFCPPQGWADWKKMFSGNFLRPLTLLFIASVLYHAWIGVRDIWMDYIKGMALRLTLQAVTAVVLIFYFIWSVAILWG
jgi:succinate dehydrogenase / fumarate reductase, membrane anchor subunit